jgi:hypothetical protein
MALSTYAQLKAAVADWLNRDDLTSQVADFIALFEADFDADRRTAQHRRRICRSTATIDSEYETLPVNYLAIQSIEFDMDPMWRLEHITPEELANRKQTEDDWRDAITADTDIDPAPPKYFAIVGTEIRFFPEPDTGESYTALMNVYERLDQLADETDYNWCLTVYPNAYLYGSLLQAAPFMKDDDRVAVWQGLYDLAIQKIQSSDPLPADPNVIRADTPPLRQATSSATFRP